MKFPEIKFRVNIFLKKFQRDENNFFFKNSQHVGRLVFPAYNKRRTVIVGWKCKPDRDLSRLGLSIGWIKRRKKNIVAVCPTRMN